MAQIKNRFGLPVQSGEFIDIRNGICHILSYVEEWEDAPENTSGYRGVYLHGLTIGKLELRARVINDRGFAELDSEYKQSIAEEPLTQEAFDVWIDPDGSRDQFTPITVRQFCELAMVMKDGGYFVKFARSCLYPHEISQIGKEWNEFKIREKLPKPDAGTISKWIDKWLSTRPELDAPWNAKEISIRITPIEEPAERDDAKHPFVGRKVLIHEMEGEPQYAGKTGVVTSVDDAGQIHGTWGGCALVEGDRYEFIDSDKEEKLPKEGPKTKYWSVPVVYEMYGSISVEAESAEEAYDKVKEHPEDYGLPDEGFYVDDSFKVADDDRENAIGTIKSLSCPD